MNRLALVLGLLALLVPAGATGRGSTAPGPAHQTSIFYYPWYGNPQVDGSFMHWNQNGHIPPLDLATSTTRPAARTRAPILASSQRR